MQLSHIYLESNPSPHESLFTYATGSSLKRISSTVSILFKQALILLLFISPEAPIFGMKAAAIDQTTIASSREITQGNDSPMTFVLALPWDIVKIILAKYFYALGIENYPVITDGLGKLLEAFASHSFQRRTDILEILVDIYSPHNTTKLLLACEVSSRPGVFEWIQCYSDLKKELLVSCAGSTPLISALRSPSPETATFLISLAPRVRNLRNDNGCTPLMVAAEQNNCVALNDLLTRGVQISATDHEGSTALHKAVANRCYEAAEILLVAQANPDMRTLADGFTPLYFAILLRNETLARLLLLHKANPNIGTTESITPLMHVLYAYHQIKKEGEEGYQEQLVALEAILKRLLENPLLKVNKPGLYGVSPLSKALECGFSSDIITAFTSKGARLSPKELIQVKKAQQKNLKSKKYFER